MLLETWIFNSLMNHFCIELKPKKLNYYCLSYLLFTFLNNYAKTLQKEPTHIYGLPPLHATSNPLKFILKTHFTKENPLKTVPFFPFPTPFPSYQNTWTPYKPLNTSRCGPIIVCLRKNIVWFDVIDFSTQSLAIENWHI